MRIPRVLAASLLSMATAAILCAAPADVPRLFPSVVNIEPPKAVKGNRPTPLPLSAVCGTAMFARNTHELCKPEPVLHSWGGTWGEGRIEPKALKAVGITGAKEPIPAGGFADLSVEAGKSASVTWRISPQPVQRAKDLPTNRLIFGGKAGTTYSVTAFVVDFDAKTVADTETEVVFAGAPNPQPHPEPGPNPNPQPEPPPVPVGTVSTFVVVEDTTKAGVWRSEILGSPEVEKFYRQLRGPRSGLIHKLVDVSAAVQTPESKKWIAAVPAGKSLPYVFMQDATGKVIHHCAVPTTNALDFIACFDMHADAPRAMGLIMPTEDKPKLGLFSKDNPEGWKQFGTTPTTPIIPRAQWPKSRRLTTFLPAVYDQDGRGQCASSSACNVLEIAARIQGLEYPKLSAGDLYARVNDGRDEGSMLEDNLKELIANGVAPASMVPYVWDGKFGRSQAVIAERRKYRAVEAYWCPNIDAAVSATLQGFAVGVGLLWYDNFKPIDAAGWMPMKGTCSSRRCPGGHAVTLYGIETKADGTVGLVIRNSWSATWGISGDCILPETLFSGHIGGFYAVRVVTDPATVTRGRDPFNLRGEFAFAW